MWSTLSRRGISTTISALKGHSKWQNIKDVKGKNDMLKSKNTNALLRKVRAAVSRGGFDPKINRELATLEQDFRAQGLSLDTFKGFLQKLKDKPEVEVNFDVIGPNGTFFIVQAETDNKRAMESTLRKYFNKIGGFRMAQDASAVRSWFDEKGVLMVGEMANGKAIPFEQMEERGIELDCEEVTLVEEDGTKKFELLCDSRQMHSVESQLSKLGFTVDSAEIEFRPKHAIEVAADVQQQVEKFYTLVQEDESIRQIFDNIEPDN